MDSRCVLIWKVSVQMTHVESLICAMHASLTSKPLIVCLPSEIPPSSLCGRHTQSHHRRRYPSVTCTVRSSNARIMCCTSGTHGHPVLSPSIQGWLECKNAAGQNVHRQRQRSRPENFRCCTHSKGYALGVCEYAHRVCQASDAKQIAKLFP